PVAAGAEHAVERLAGGNQARPRFRGDDLVDQRVDDRIGDAGEVVGTRGRGRLRGEIGAQRVAGRAEEAVPLDAEVEVEGVDPQLVLDRVDDTDGRIDAERGEVLDQRHVVRLE